MKYVMLFLFSVLMSLNIWGGGGVDVGNFNQKGFFGSFPLPEFQSEEAMVAHMQTILPAVQDGSYKEVQAMAKKGQCSKTDITFEELEVINTYIYSQKNLKLNQQASGLVIMKFKDCKRPDRVKNEAEF